MDATYDEIGAGYNGGRRADPRIWQRVMGAIGQAASVLDVGTGTGNYSPTDRLCIGVDPSDLMLTTRDRAGRGPSVQATAEALPFQTSSFDCSVGVLTVHHWRDLHAGLQEMNRTSRKQVLFIREPFRAASDFWLLEYFPSIMELEATRSYPTTAEIGQTLGLIQVEDIAVPADCVDGFFGCYWNHPEAFLDEAVRRCMSTFRFLSDQEELDGVRHLQHDMESGRWDANHGSLRTQHEYFVGHKLLTASS